MVNDEYCDEKKFTSGEEDACFGPCPLERGMRIIGKKWAGSILWHLKDKPLRFNELSRQIPAASRNMLNERLKELEERKLVIRTVITDKPIAVQYEVSDFGQTALGFLDEIQQWATEHNI